jgi:hypothetical protein
MTDQECRALGEHLQQVIAQALDAPDDEGGRLTPEEIEVRFQIVSPRTINPSPFALEILANDYPSRKANLDYRVSRIARELRAFPTIPQSVIDDKGGFVWVLLGAGGFEKL